MGLSIKPANTTQLGILTLKISQTQLAPQNAIVKKKKNLYKAGHKINAINEMVHVLNV